MALLSLAVFALLTPPFKAQVAPEARYSELSWRCIGPFRGGRTASIDGDWSHPNVFYMGVCNGGVWKTNDYGRTWNPIFDDQPTGSIGAVAVAQSNPKTLYVGSGEGLQRPDLSVGDGLYKSTDGGKHWQNMGLRDGQQITDIAVDPANENRLFVSVLGHPYGPNEERGIFRSLDGGQTWQKVLYVDANTGAAAIKFDPTNTQTLYADLWAARQGPWENGEWEGTTSGLYKSVDGGTTWHPLTKGLPTSKDGLGRIGFSICKANPKRLYANVDATKNGGIYRSEDGGESWVLVNTDARLWGRGSDFAEVTVDPSDPDTVYSANTSVYRSRDAGKTYTCIKGAPGGDDYHKIWISPTNSDLIGIACDQGATISVNGGETWSSWYNQPTAQFYHVSTDNAFPYRVYGGQQESGSVGISSRGPDGQITFREWRPVGAEEYAFIAPDPLNPDVIYGNKGVTKFNWKTFKTETLPLGIKDLRLLRSMPLIFSPIDHQVLYQASQFLLETRDGGKTWKAISPDLSREKWDVPASFGSVAQEGAKMKRRGVIYAVAPSPLKNELIWCGTDDGLVWLTRDGGAHWDNVTPPDLSSWSKVSQIDAGHFDVGTAYISVNRLRCDDQAPCIYATHDFGKTWTEIVGGLPAGPINVVREDPRAKRLLYCGSETQVYTSFDDGASWHSLRLNMPATSIRDLVVKDDDLVIGTHGRSFWILDQVNRLRDLETVLAKPSPGYLVEWNNNTDTPLPPEEPAGKNPPDGVAIDYYLADSAGYVKLEILDRDGKAVRTITSEDKPVHIPDSELTVDPRWQRPPQVLAKTQGAHRFVYDLRKKATGKPALGIAAIWFDTPPQSGEFIAPGKYRVRLTIDGKTFEQPLEAKADPRAR